MERTAYPRHAKNGGRLASGGFPAVLEMAVTSSTSGRQKAREQGGPGLDLPHGGGKSLLGSTPHSRRVAQAGLQALGADSLALASARPETSRYGQRWLTFLRNNREAIAAMNFFTVPTITFGVLYCFFVIGHDRRKILHFNVTRNPNALWIVQQMREGWPYTVVHKLLLFYRDSKFGTDVVSFVRDMGVLPVRTAFRSPWQNGIAERWVGSCRRDLLDHVIVLNERHLKRLMTEYVRYYHEDRTHLGLAKDTPAGRPIAHRSATGSEVRSFPRLGGLHHRYAA
jgi:transposase InsO family protein